MNLVGKYREDWESTWNVLSADENLNRYERTEAAFNAGGESMAINAAKVTSQTIYELEQEILELKIMLIKGTELLVAQNEVLLERFKVSLNG